MKTIEIKLYEFDELSENAKDTAIKEWYESESYEYLSDEILCYIHSVDSYFSDISLCYSLSCSQGDGLSFYGASLNLKKFIMDKYGDFLGESLIRSVINVMDVTIKKDRYNRYGYPSTSDILFSYDDDSVVEDLETNGVNFENIESDITNYYLTLCGKAEKFGYGILDYRMTIQEMSDLCTANEYLFYENGKTY